MSEKLIIVAIIDHDKDFFENSLALLRQEKDIEVCAAYLRPDIGKQAPVSQEAAMTFADVSLTYLSTVKCL